MLDVGGVGQFWLDGRGALWDKIESKSRARSWYELGAEFLVAHSDLPLQRHSQGEASHHHVTEARPEQQFGKQRREIFKAFWYRRVIIIYASTRAPSLALMGAA
jgi:hypothetical protein